MAGEERPLEARGYQLNGFWTSMPTALLSNGGGKKKTLLLYQASKRSFYTHLLIPLDCCISSDEILKMCYKNCYTP